MKIHTPIFILGLLVFVTPIIGLPQLYEQIILGAYGVAIMVLVSTIHAVANFREKKNSSNEVIRQTEIVDHEKEGNL